MQTTHPLVGKLDDLGYRVQPLGRRNQSGYSLYLVDLSEWKLRLSEVTPLIWVTREDMDSMSVAEISDSLSDLTRLRGWLKRPSVVLADADGSALKSRLAGRSSPTLVVIDSEDQRSVLAARSPTGRLLDLISAQVSIARLAPYVDRQPVCGSRFFGRDREINSILDDESNFAILGIRRIGKTSLLEEVRYRMLEQGHKKESMVWLDCQTIKTPDQFTQEVVRQLRVQELKRLKQHGKYFFSLSDFFRRMSLIHKSRITLFLDESDRFLKWARNTSKILETIRAATTAGYCRFLATGFGQLQSELFNQDSPLLMAFTCLTLGHFSKDETKQVVLRPMESLRIKVESGGELVSRIHEATAGHPVMVQTFCRWLVEELDKTGSRKLSPADLEQVYTSDGVRQMVMSLFRQNLETRQKAVVYALLASFPEEKRSYTQSEMNDALRRYQCCYTYDQIDEECDLLVTAGVMTRKGKEFHFSNQLLPQVLRANYPLEDYLVEAAMELAG
jgi:Cdc6-like AAA superfamily ATPase